MTLARTFARLEEPFDVLWPDRLSRRIRAPRASFSYRYRLMADAPGAGPISAVFYIAVQESRIYNHCAAEGAENPGVVE